MCGTTFCLREATNRHRCSLLGCHGGVLSASLAAASWMPKSGRVGSDRGMQLCWCCLASDAALCSHRTTMACWTKWLSHLPLLALHNVGSVCQKSVRVHKWWHVCVCAVLGGGISCSGAIGQCSTTADLGSTHAPHSCDYTTAQYLTILKLAGVLQPCPYTSFHYNLENCICYGPPRRIASLERGM